MKRIIKGQEISMVFVVSTIGLTLWNQSSFEFKFDDTRLSLQYKNKIGSIKKNLLSPDVT